MTVDIYLYDFFDLNGCKFCGDSDKMWGLIHSMKVEPTSDFSKVVLFDMQGADVKKVMAVDLLPKFLVNEGLVAKDIHLLQLYKLLMENQTAEVTIIKR